MHRDDEDVTPEPDTTTPDDIKTEPPGNPEPDADAVEAGKDKLDGTLPY